MNLNFCVILKNFSYPDIKIISFIMILSAFRICPLIFRCMIHLELTFKYSVTEESYYILLLRRTLFFSFLFSFYTGLELTCFVSIPLVVILDNPTCRLNLSQSKFNQYFNSSSGHD